MVALERMRLEETIARLRAERDGYGEPMYTIGPPVDAGAVDFWGDTPAGLRELAAITSFISGGYLHLELPEVLRAYGDDLLGELIEIGHSGFGSYWVLDAAGRVWWLGHDPNVITLAGRSIEELLQRAEGWDEGSSPHESPATPRAVEEALAAGGSARIGLDEIATGEGFDFDLHCIDREGDALVITRLDVPEDES